MNWNLKIRCPVRRDRPGSGRRCARVRCTNRDGRQGSGTRRARVSTWKWTTPGRGTPLATPGGGKVNTAARRPGSACTGSPANRGFRSMLPICQFANLPICQSIHFNIVVLIISIELSLFIYNNFNSGKLCCLFSLNSFQHDTNYFNWIQCKLCCQFSINPFQYYPNYLNWIELSRVANFQSIITKIILI